MNLYYYTIYVINSGLSGREAQHKLCCLVYWSRGWSNNNSGGVGFDNCASGLFLALWLWSPNENCIANTPRSQFVGVVLLFVICHNHCTLRGWCWLTETDGS